MKITPKLTRADVETITGLLRSLVNVLVEKGVIDLDAKKKEKTAMSSASLNTKTKEVLSYYKKIHPAKGRAVKPGHKDFELICSRLKEGFSVAELCKAIDGNLEDPWHQEARGGHSLPYIFRNSAKVEGFLEKKKQSNETVGHHKGSEEHKDGPQRLSTD